MWSGREVMHVRCPVPCPVDWDDPEFWNMEFDIDESPKEIAKPVAIRELTKGKGMVVHQYSLSFSH